MHDAAQGCRNRLEPMIIKASQRGFGGELAVHLLNEQDNDHVDVHAIKGFAAHNIKDAFAEAEIISRGTRCSQYLFSVSLSPPQDADVSTKEFEDAIGRVSAKLGLHNQPHVIVFHEKNARRHCHVVYSRIDGQEMKAINLPYYKNKLMEISKELYLENEWRLPQGFIDKTKRNPLNYSLHEWQTAKRAGKDPKLTKLVLKECWAISDNKSSFENALEQHGFYLAKGDRRGFVAVDWKGKIYSLSKWCDLKSNALKERLGDPKELPTAEQAIDRFDQVLVQRMEKLNKKVAQAFDPKLDVLQKRKLHMREAHIQARQELSKRHEVRWAEETERRQQRLGRGVQGVWNRITRKYGRIKQQNEMEAYQSMMRDQKEKDELIFEQINQRRSLQSEIETVVNEKDQALNKLQHDVFSRLPEHKIEVVKPTFEVYQVSNERSYGPEM